MRRIIVFDVDGTLVRGHLLTRALIRACFLKPSLAFRGRVLIRELASMGSKKLPQALSRALRFQDFDGYDRRLRHNVSQLLRTAERVLASCGCTLACVAEQTLTPSVFKSIIRPEGLAKLREHLADQSNSVVLLSASPMDVLVPLHQWLCSVLGADAERIILRGTVLNGDETNACIGSMKVLAMYEMFGKTGIDKVYTDNGSLADLPLIKTAAATTIVGRKNAWYRFVPPEWLARVRFGW